VCECSYVHGRLPYDKIAADPRLAALLQTIPQRKIVSVLHILIDRNHLTSLC
jgi:hypothetical protein